MAGLLGRIRRRASGQRAAALEEEILGHLRLLLNVRRGGSAVDPDYGLPDLTDLAHRIPEGLPMLQRMLSDTIEKHEPRLRHVSVRSVPLANAVTTLKFEVVAQLRSGEALRFQTVLSHGGHVSVQ